MAVRLWETFTFYSYDLLDKNARVNTVDIDQVAACQIALRAYVAQMSRMSI